MNAAIAIGALSLGVLAMLEAGPALASPKRCSITVTAEGRANAVRNAARHEWASAEQKSAIAAAAPYVALSDEALWSLVPGQELPRSIHVYNVLGTDKMPLCPKCGRGIVPFGNYPWKCDALARPWKIECPNCHEVFPKNDFGAYYLSALDEHGFFRKGKGNQRLLFNTEHPDASDLLHTYAVDDGYGWQQPGGERWDFVAVYTQWGLWPTIKNAISTLANAYTHTGDAQYARKCGVLLARLADVYPDMDWYPMVRQGFSHSDGSSGVGRVEGCIWETYNGTSWCLAYDRIYDALREDGDLAAFVGRKHQEQRLPAIASPAQLADHVERHLIEEIVEGVKDGRIFGNQGMHQSTMIAAALALDRPGGSNALIEWAFAPGARDFSNRNATGKAPLAGGGLRGALTDLMDRDGLGNEGAPGYSLWGGSLQQVADLLEACPTYHGYSIYRNFPKFHQYFLASWRWSCLEAVTPPIGDSGGTGRWGCVTPGAAALLSAYRVYRELELARWALHLLGGKLDSVHGSIFDADPEKLRADVAEAAKNAPPLSSQLMDGFGLAILQTPQAQDGRALWMYFGRNTGHGHLDRLNLGLYACGIDMLPDLGYPEFASGRPRDHAWTRNNASHAVPTVDAASQLPSYTGHVNAFEPEGKVRLVDVSSDGLYPGATTVRRTAWMVDDDEQHSYVLDIVRLRGGSRHTLCWPGPSDAATATGLTLAKQPTGTYAGPDVPAEAEAKLYDKKAGYSFLTNVERAANPPAVFTVDWLARDAYNQPTPGREPHLLLHSLTPLTEAALADGEPPQNRKGAPRKLRYLMLDRRGQDLDSTFVTVLEPYDKTPLIRSVRLVPVVDAPAGTNPVAVEVTLANGRVDTLIATERPGHVQAGGVTLDGACGFVARQDGKVAIARLMGGVRLSCDGLDLRVPTSAYTGEIRSAEPGYPDDQRILLSAAIPKEGRVPGRVLIVRNDGAQDAAYIVKAWPTETTASLGGISLVRSLVDPKEPERGVVTNVQRGQRFVVPTFAYVENPGAKDGIRLTNTRIGLQPK